MGASPFARAIEAVAAPLRFAARDAHARGRLRDLDATVSAAARRAAGLAVPAEAKRILRRVAEAFEAQPGAEPARAPRRRRPGAGRGENGTDAGAQRVARALAWLAPLVDPDYSERALAQSCAILPGVGPRRAEALARRGIQRVSDLLFHLPTRYDDRRALAPIARLEVGRRASFVGRVLLGDFVPVRGRGRYRRTFQAVVEDETGTVALKWFRGGEALRGVLQKGALVLVTGDVRRYRFAKELLHPEVERLDAEGEAGATEPAALRRIVPDYPTPEGLNPRALRRLVQTAVRHAADLVPGHLPEGVARARGLPEPAPALHAVHCPSAEADLEALRERTSAAHERLVLEELYLLEVGLALRHAERGGEPGVAIPLSDAQARALEGALPFRLTAGQRRAWGEIRRDLARPHPMRRLLQGDVGSGKTAVAFLAARAVAAAGCQSALMAPTELLAEQHARTLERLAAAGRASARRSGREAGGEPTPLRIALLTASQRRADADAVRAALEAGELDLVVGTHALLQKGVRIARLALAVVDEQHRFGVLQRAGLTARTAERESPHVLVMTATPIPRTLALTVYGDLDYSVIDDLPPGRRPGETLLLRSGEGARVVEAIEQTLARGEQVYVVYPLVEESEKVDLRAATESFERIRARFRRHRVDLLHGRQSAAERAEAMARFERGETRILVSTTVIEVGVDVPAATLMVVEHAERFGLAQLHQLRGRVGRGGRPGRCLLVARGSSEESEARLRALLETDDGFRIADADLRIRGPGEFLGTRQSGRLPDLRIADLIRDARLLPVARDAAFDTLRRDPGLRRHSDLARAVASRWGDRLAVAGVG